MVNLKKEKNYERKKKAGVMSFPLPPSCGNFLINDVVMLLIFPVYDNDLSSIHVI